MAHHNVGKFFLPSFNIHDDSHVLQQRNFMGKLFKVGAEKCKEFLPEATQDKQNLVTCRNEIMVAASCVLLSKTSNLVGDWRDNVGLCRNEIKIVKNNLKEKFQEFPEQKLDQFLKQLNFSTKSFC